METNLNREIAVSLTVAAQMRAAGRLDVAFGWVGEARRLRLIREMEQA